MALHALIGPGRRHLLRDCAAQAGRSLAGELANIALHVCLIMKTVCQGKIGERRRIRRKQRRQQTAATQLVKISAQALPVRGMKTALELARAHRKVRGKRRQRQIKRFHGNNQALVQRLPRGNPLKGLPHSGDALPFIASVESIGKRRKRASMRYDIMPIRPTFHEKTACHAEERRQATVAQRDDEQARARRSFSKTRCARAAAEHQTRKGLTAVMMQSDLPAQYYQQRGIQTCRNVIEAGRHIDGQGVMDESAQCGRRRKGR